MITMIFVLQSVFISEGKRVNTVQEIVGGLYEKKQQV